MLCPEEKNERSLSNRHMFMDVSFPVGGKGRSPTGGLIVAISRIFAEPR